MAELLGILSDGCQIQPIVYTRSQCYGCHREKTSDLYIFSFCSLYFLDYMLNKISDKEFSISCFLFCINFIINKLESNLSQNVMVLSLCFKCTKVHQRVFPDQHINHLISCQQIVCKRKPLIC